MFALILIVVVLALIWLLFIMPQRRRQSVQNRMLQDLEVGDEVLTIGGMYGQVHELGDDEVVVEIAPGTRVRMARRSIAAIVDGDGDEQVDEDETEAEPEPLEDSESEDVKRR